MSDLEKALAVLEPDRDRLGFDVEGVKTAFFASPLKLNEFLALHPEYPKSVSKVAKEEGWSQLRMKFRQGVSIEARSKLGIDISEVEAKMDRMVHRATKQVVKCISSILTQAAELQEELRLEDLGKLKQGVDALQQSYTLMRKTAGLTPEPMPGGGLLDLEKLSHEERMDLESLLKKAKKS